MKVTHHSNRNFLFLFLSLATISDNPIFLSSAFWFMFQATVCSLFEYAYQSHKNTGK